MLYNVSKVYLLNTPLEDDLSNTIYFADEQSQQTYFRNRVGKMYTDVSYQSEDKQFRCSDKADVVRNYNYIMWQNPAYSDKWFYAFIKKVEHISNGRSDIYFEVDPLQTYRFDYTVLPSFIEREHTNNDTAGNNTLPENVELGEYVKNSVTGISNVTPGSTIWYAVGVSDIIGSLSKNPGSIINNVPNGLFYIITDAVSSLHTIARMYDNDGKANAIYTMFAFPKEILNVGGSYAYQSATWNYDKGTFHTSMNVYVPTSSNRASRIFENNTLIYKPNRVGKTYTPRNNKLYTFPYCYFNISNNAGTSVTYHYEDFDGDPKFGMEGVFGIGCSVKLYPTNYKGMGYYGDYDNSYDYGITGAKYPTVSWISDSFTNWITQNAVNIGMSATQTTISTATSVALGNVAGATMSFLGGVSSAIGETYKASLMPDQVKGNTNVGDITFAKYKNAFTIYPLSIKPEYAACIDDYFDMFGYKTNRLKTPNFAHRENWWYTKTVNANIDGNIPHEYITKIKDAYDNGLTFWRNPANFLNYSVSNGIV